MLTIGVRGHDVATDVSLETLAEAIEKTEINYIQFALGISMPEFASEAVISPGLGSQIKQIFENKAITIAILSCYINLIHPDEEIRQQLLNKFKAYIRNASTFGAKIVATETGGVDAEIHYTEKNYTEEAYQKVLSSVKQLTAEAEKNGIIIGIEPGINHPIHSLELTERLLKEADSSNMGIILDPTNLIRWNTFEHYNEILAEAFQRFGKRIVALHVKDFIVQDKRIIPAAIGTGKLNVRDTIQQLEGLKPGIFTIFEETQGSQIESAYQLVKKALGNQK